MRAYGAVEEGVDTEFGDCGWLVGGSDLIGMLGDVGGRVVLTFPADSFPESSCVGYLVWVVLQLFSLFQSTGTSILTSAYDKPENDRCEYQTLPVVP